MMTSFFKIPITLLPRTFSMYDGQVLSTLPSVSTIPAGSCLAFTISQANILTFNLTGTKSELPVSESVAFNGELGNRGFQLFDTLTSITAAGDLGGNVSVYPLREDGAPAVGTETGEEILVDKASEPYRVSVEVPGEARATRQQFKYFFPNRSDVVEGLKFLENGVTFTVEAVVPIQGFPNFVSHLEVMVSREPFVI